MAEHRPPLSSPGRLALDRLGAVHLEVLLLIGVATAGRYMTSRERDVVYFLSDTRAGDGSVAFIYLQPSMAWEG